MKNGYIFFSLYLKMFRYLLCLTAVFAFKIPNRRHVPLDMCSSENQYCSIYPSDIIPLNATMDTFEEALYKANNTKVLFYGNVMTSLRWYLLSRTDNITKIHAVDKELQKHLNMDERTPFSMVYVKITDQGNYYYETFSWSPKLWTPSRMFEIFLKAEENSLVPEYISTHDGKFNEVLNLTYFDGNPFIHPLKIWVVLYYVNDQNEHVRNISKWMNKLSNVFGENIEFYCHDLSVKKTSINMDYVPSVVLYSSLYKQNQSHVVLTPPVTFESMTLFIDSNINLKMDKEFQIYKDEDVERVLEEYK